MEQTCLRCSRLVLRPLRDASCRTFATSRYQYEEPNDRGITKAGSSIADAMKPKSLIRRVDFNGPSPASKPNSTDATMPARRPRPLIRRTESEASTQSGANPGQILRRTTQPGQVLTRSRPPGSSAGARPGGSFLRRGPPGTGAGRPQQGGKPGQKPVDKRRRRTRTNDGEVEIDEKLLQKQMDEYITKYIDRPENPTEPVPYSPKETKVQELRSDWPNTPLSTVGMTESVVQKIEWLARRLPHGFQSPESIAEHYLKGNLTRFESDEEKQLVLKIASEMSAKTKQGLDDGTVRYFKHHRFPYVEDPKFTSIHGKEDDKNFLLSSSVKGDYADATQHKFSVTRNIAKALENNGSYGPVQTQKLLARVQALIPQGRVAAKVKKA